jgi:hypothetical protein
MSQAVANCRLTLAGQHLASSLVVLEGRQSANQIRYNSIAAS